MLILKPNCECCNKDLAANTSDAMICSYECTFCLECVKHTLENVCPNCGGGFTPRPIRPSTEHRSGISLSHQPASFERVNTKLSIQEIKAFSQGVKDIPPEKR